MPWVVAALSVALALSLAALAAQRLNLRAANRQLRAILRGDADSRLRLSAPNRGWERLLRSINDLLDARQRDLAAHAQLEQDLRRQIANISHDLRTPLTSVLGYLQLLQAADCTPGEREQYLQIIEARARALQSLVAGFYDLSRLEAGEVRFDWAQVRLDALLREQLASLYYDLVNRGLEPDLTVPEDLPPVRADAAAANRIIANLLHNALRHGENGVLRIVLAREGELIAVRLTNPASHLTAEDVQHLFDRFYTADRMRTGLGTGLGLAIVRSLVLQMGGEVQASLHGGLLTIRFALPAA